MNIRRRVWYSLVDAEGHAYGIDDSKDSVWVRRFSLVVDLRDAVKAKRPELKDVAAANLKVYRARADPKFDGSCLRQDARIPRSSWTVPLTVVAKIPEQATVQKVALDRSTIEQLIDQFRDQIIKPTSIVLSKVRQEQEEEIRAKIPLTLGGAKWNPSDKWTTRLGHIMEPYKWMDNKSEDDEEQRKMYMAHLGQYLNFPNDEGRKYGMKDCGNIRNILKIPKFLDQFNISGTTDVVISEQHHIDNGAIKNNIAGQLELKKPAKKGLEQYQSQAIMELLAAAFLSPDLGELTVLTDLNDEWFFYWLSCETTRVFKLRTTRILAAHLLNNMFATKDQAQFFPQDFCNRGKWRTDANSDGAKNRTHGNIGNQDRDGYSSDNAGPSDNFPSSEPGGGNLGASQSKDMIQGTQRSMGGLQCLLLPGNTDVANTADLMDVVDEDDRLEIAMHKVAEYALPFMLYDEEKRELVLDKKMVSNCDGGADKPGLSAAKLARLNVMNSNQSELLMEIETGTLLQEH